MNPRDQDDFLKEVFANEELDSFREDSLAHSLSALRTRRRIRTMRIAVLAAVPLVALAVAVLWPGPKHITVATVQTPLTVASSTPSRIKFYPATVASEAPPIAAISDEELLAMFKGHSVGLLGHEGQEKLVFFDGPQIR